MTTNNQRTIIKVRRGTSAEWSASSPQPGGEVLKLGEPGYEKDTKKLKIGDGVTPWNDLPYLAAGTIIVEDIDHLISDVIQAGTGIDLNFDDVNDTLTISTDGVSFDGHTHTSSQITDFNSSVSGLIPTINNAGDNRLLTSDGTATGINAENRLTFNGQIVNLNCTCPSGLSGYYVTGDGFLTNFKSNIFYNEDVEPPRMIFRRSRGSAAAPEIANLDDGIFAIRGESLDYDKNPVILGGLRMEIDGPATSGSLYPSTRIFLRTSKGGNDPNSLLNRTLMLNGTDGSVTNTGSIEGYSLIADNITIDNNTISSTDTNGVINISPDGTGNTNINSANIVVGDGAATTTITTSTNTSNLRLATNNYSVSANIVIEAGDNGKIFIKPNGTGSVVIGDSSNVGNGAYSSVIGGKDAAARLHGEVCHSGGGLSSVLGSSQHSLVIAKRTTNDDTPDIVLTLDGNSPGSNNRLVLPEYSVWGFTITLSAFGSDDNGGVWIFRGAIKRDSTNNVALIESINEIKWRDTTFSSASATVTADNTNKALEIKVTGLLGVNINWSAVVDISQVIYD